MTTRALMILVAEAAMVAALAVLMGDLPLLAVFGLFSTWIVGASAYLVRIAGRPSSRSGWSTLGLVAAGVAVYLGMALLVPPPFVPMIAGALVAVAMIREGHRGWVPSGILIASGGLVFLAWLVRVAGHSLPVALSSG